MNVPLITYDEAKAGQAYLAYIAILAQQKADPSLVENPAWTILRQEAYATFHQAFTVNS